MTMQDITQQAAKFQDQARASGLSGTMYILSCPAEGWIKVQLKDVPTSLTKQLIDGLQQTMAMGGNALNLQVKVKTQEAGSNAI